MTVWTDELRAEAIEAYEAAEPTAENSMDVVKKIAEDMEQSPNGVRAILSKAGVYVAKGNQFLRQQVVEQLEYLKQTLRHLLLKLLKRQEKKQMIPSSAN